jgi:hypothetical protein
MSEEDQPRPPRLPGAKAAVRRWAGAFTRRGYPEDRHTRQKTALAAALASAMGIVGQQALASSRANQKLLEMQAAQATAAEARADKARQDYRDAITGMADVAAAIRAQTAEMEKDRRELYNKIPNARGQPYQVRFHPAPQGIERHADIGGVKP